MQGWLIHLFTSQPITAAADTGLHRIQEQHSDIDFIDALMGARTTLLPNICWLS